MALLVKSNRTCGWWACLFYQQYREKELCATSSCSLITEGNFACLIWVFSGCSSWRNLSFSNQTGDLLLEQSFRQPIFWVPWCAAGAPQNTVAWNTAAFFSLAQGTNKGVHSHCDSVTGLLLWCGRDPNGSVALPSFRGRSHHLAAASNVQNCISLLVFWYSNLF